jgi:hypothetical protein
MLLIVVVAVVPGYNPESSLLLFWKRRVEVVVIESSFKMFEVKSFPI